MKLHEKQLVSESEYRLIERMKVSGGWVYIFTLQVEAGTRLQSGTACMTTTFVPEAER